MSVATIPQGESISFCRGINCDVRGKKGGAVLRSTASDGLLVQYSWFSSAGARHTDVCQQRAADSPTTGRWVVGA